MVEQNYSQQSLFSSWQGAQNHKKSKWAFLTVPLLISSQPESVFRAAADQTSFWMNLWSNIRNTGWTRRRRSRRWNGFFGPHTNWEWNWESGASEKLRMNSKIVTGEQHAFILEGGWKNVEVLLQFMIRTTSLHYCWISVLLFFR